MQPLSRMHSTGWPGKGLAGQGETQRQKLWVAVLTRVSGCLAQYMGRGTRDGIPGWGIGSPL